MIGEGGGVSQCGGVTGEVVVVWVVKWVWV